MSLLVALLLFLQSLQPHVACPQVATTAGPVPCHAPQQHVEHRR